MATSKKSAPKKNTAAAAAPAKKTAPKKTTADDIAMEKDVELAGPPHITNVIAAMTSHMDMNMRKIVRDQLLQRLEDGSIVHDGIESEELHDHITEQLNIEE